MDEETNTEDADLETENSEEDEEEGDEEETEETESDEDEDDEEEAPDNKTLSKQIKAVEKTLSDLKAAARRASKKKQPITNEDPKDKKTPDTDARLAAIELSNKKRDFAIDHGLSPQQTDFVFKQTSRPTGKFLKQPHIKAALDAMAKSTNVRENTPRSGGGKPFTVKGKSFHDLDAKDKQSNFRAHQESILQGKGRR